MGIALWVTAAAAAFGAGRAISLRRHSWWVELLTALFAGLVAGLAATAMDFGGWKEPDWRAGLFALFVSFAALGMVRLLPGRS